MSWPTTVALGLSVREGVQSRDEGAMLAALDALAARDGRYPASFSIWVDWGDLGPSAPRWTMPTLATLEAMDAMGVCPVIFWQPVQAGNEAVPFAEILSGAWDAYIDAFADSAAGFGRRIIVRFAHEGNAPWFPWAIGKAGNTTAGARAAHRYVHDRVRAVAPEVAFLWCPNATKPAYLPYAALYPGNDACELVGFDAYLWNGTVGKSPVDLWRPSIDELRTVTGGKRAIVVGETGVVATGDPADAAFRRAWLRDGFREAQAEWPILAAILYFDIDVSAIDEPDWRLGAVPNLLVPWRNLMADPGFGGTLR